MARKSRDDAASQPDFEQSLQQLEALVERLERGDLPLSESLSLFEQGVALTRQCHARLSEAQQRVEILLKEGGAARLADFTAQGDLPGEDS
ncbi:MAG: exodeoxyribonuclease VII small subunit [Nevskiaceae bacterium]|jgi:exodeoxyribonuclease VII small subunit|nr:exodeoxyribonuclease VII small subunit [Nevskiaceae bacterium]